jgi:hypothetical protein
MDLSIIIMKCTCAWKFFNSSFCFFLYVERCLLVFICYNGVFKHHLFLECIAPCSPNSLALQHGIKDINLRHDMLSMSLLEVVYYIFS